MPKKIIKFIKILQWTQNYTVEWHPVWQLVSVTQLQYPSVDLLSVFDYLQKTFNVLFNLITVFN
jgi:hypothetical protein